MLPGQGRSLDKATLAMQAQIPQQATADLEDCIAAATPAVINSTMDQARSPFKFKRGQQSDEKFETLLTGGGRDMYT